MPNEELFPQDGPYQGAPIYLRMPGSPRPEIPAYWQSVPGSTDEAPRDGQRIERGKDLLFLAMVLKNFKPPSRWLKRFVLEGSRRQRYLLQEEDGVLRHPVTLKEVTLEHGWILTMAIFARTLRRRMREHFYGQRRGILRLLAWEVTETVIVNGRTLTKEGERRDAHGEFMNSLRWPLGAADDPIIDHLPALQWLGFEEVQVPSHLDAICPLDGSVRPLLLQIISPQWTWEHLCGQHWALALCPHCLGEFTSQLVAMN
jgi:hypothetical protein